MSNAKNKEFNVINFLLDFDSGELNDEAIVKGFQYLIDNGLAWELKGVYSRMASALIDEGYCTNKGN